LAEAKEAVELIAAGKPPPSGAAPSLSADAMQEVSALIAAGRKIEAIKVYRKAAGVDLKDAKDAVDALEGHINPAAVVTRAAAMRRVVVSGLVVVAALVALVFLLTRG
jgi:ribosomal protein L7/L12